MALTEEQPSDTLRRSEPHAKRRRIGLACNACRSRKSRCDGQRPTCSACKSLDFECQYEVSEPSPNAILRKGYLSDLESRMTNFERILERHDDLLRGHLSACVSHGSTSWVRTSESQDVLASAGGVQEDDWHAPTLEEPRDEEAGTDGLAMSFVEESTTTYFGESSNINFTRLLLRVISAMRNAPPTTQSVAGEEYSLVEKKMATFLQKTRSPKESLKATSQASLTVLPSIEEMDEMLDIFFRSTGLLFPFIDEVTMRATYRECVIMRLTPVRRTWLGTLNMIFAMASLSGQKGAMSTKSSLERSNHFYQRAMGLCDEVSKHVISLEVVHYQLLVVLYCQGTQRSVQAWTLHGMLVRSAIALGLHAARIENPTDACRQESGHRTWLTIYCLDKVLSMTFGRPAAIPEEYMVPKVPEPWPYASASPPSNNSDDLPREFLGVSVKLYEIMGHSLTRQYGANVGRNDLELDEMARFQALDELRRRLRGWVSTLPSHLQLCPPGAHEVLESSQANKLRVILTLKYHNLSILIHRPLLSTTLRYLAGRDSSLSVSPPYHVQLAMGEALECVKAAELTIEIVHSILVIDRTASNNLGVWFFTLYYVFTASLIIGARLLWVQLGESNAETSVAHLRAFLQMADEIFHKLDHESDLISSCARYIRYLSQLCDARVPIGSSEIRDHSITPSLSTQVGQSSDGQSGASAGTKDSSSTELNVDTLSLFSAEFLDPSVFDGFPANGGDSGFASAFLTIQ